jgi:tRNA-specific 2-thiouridylase
MSGGVDSSVAAALLVESGYEVIGVMMQLWAEEENRCCTHKDVDDARRVASQIGIPFHTVGYEADFKDYVVDYFITEYARGRTPNPCLACNQHIRFGLLLDHARELGADYLATGHYARVDRAGGAFRLRAGADPQKEQSYVLYMLGQDELERVILPLGQYSKAQVRDIARRHRMSVADKGESMEICFVTDDDYRRFLREHLVDPVMPGPIVDSAGRHIGRHSGLPFYTIGQRRGLGIASSEPLYVLQLDMDQNTLVVGPARELGRTWLHANDVRYVQGLPPEAPQRVHARIRYRATLVDATWTSLAADRARVDFDTPLRDITPGQAVVAYAGDVVLGGGIIGS